MTGSEAGSTSVLEVSTDNGTTWTATTANQSGLADGTYLFRATVTDAAGNVSTTATQTVTIDTTAPTAGTLSLTGFDDTGANTTDGLSNDNTFDLAVSGEEPGTTVSFEFSTDNGVTWTATTASQSGLADGSYQFRGVVTDAAGNVSTTAVQSVTIDNTAPSQPAIDLDAASDLGVSDTDNRTFDQTPSFTITAETGATVEVFLNGVSAGFATETAPGQFAFTSTALTLGAYQFTATATDAAGNVSAASAILDVTITLSDIDAGTMTTSQGFRIFGADAGDRAGFSVSSAGDINGDGYDDMIIGARNGDGSANDKGDAGEAIVVFGKAGGFGDIDVAAADFESSGKGFRIFGADAGDNAGRSVSSAGDINGDGFDDLIVGANRGRGSANDKGGAGEAIVVFGKAGGFGNIDVAAADFVSSGKGFRIFGADAADQAGFSVSSAGDINGDGYDDLIVGARYADGSGNGSSDAGEAIVVFGKAGGFGDIDVAAADFVSSGKGFRIFGADALDYSGWSVSSAGDINGDGFDDLIVGAYRSSGSANGKGFAGEAIVVFGKAGGFANIDVAAADFVSSGKGFRIFGADAGDRAGWSVSSAGDINGDGFDDLIVGAYRGSGSANGKAFAGEAIVVFGKVGGFGDIDVAAADFVSSGKGFRVFGADSQDQAGFSVSSAGDVNGDGFDDLLVGVRFGDGSANGKFNAGEAIVVFGKAGGFGDIDVAAADFVSSGKGFRIFGADGDDEAGYSVSSAGDINGDGFDDMIVGVPRADGNAISKANAGEAIVIFGGDFLSGVVFAGNNADNTLTGTSADETFVGGQGNDTLIGNGGTDAFQGGEGDDVLVLGSTLARRADGGTGIDTAGLDAVNGGGRLDLTGRDAKRFQNIEKIDLSGTSANTLLLSKLAVLGMAGSNGNAFDDNTILVKGDVGDRLQLLDGWTQGAAVSNPFGEAGSYITYTNGQARLLVESDVTVYTGAIDAGTMNLSQGFRIFGADAGDVAGVSVSSAGDINGDGFDDIIVGASFGYGAANSKFRAGEAIVVFGAASGFGDVDVSDPGFVTSGRGFRIFGADGSDRAGTSVSFAGDVNGDGLGDLIIGAKGAGPANNEPSAGEAIVVFGKAGGFTDIDVSSSSFVSSGQGFRIFGADADDYSYNVSSVGDINGDGFDDMAVGGALADGSSNGIGLAGEVTIVFGKASGLSDVDAGSPSLVSSGAGFRVYGSASFSALWRSSGADVNGDGYSDLILGAAKSSGSDPFSGVAYVIFGKSGGFANIDLATTDLAASGNGFRILGFDSGDALGNVIASTAGDLNGDGFEDMILGLRRGDGAGNATYNAGETVVVFGSAAGPSDINAGATDFTTSGKGFRIFGADVEDRLGCSVSSAGDVNGDGFDDLIVGAYLGDGQGNTRSNSGEAVVLFGKATGFGNIDLATVDVAASGQGFRIFGADNEDRAGWRVASAGDINGDGFDDLIIGAFGGDGSANDKGESGEAIVIFGGDFLSSVVFAGTNADNTLTGTSADETFVGGQGDDTLVGGGGSDAFQGGEGEDVIVVADASFRRIDGGSGADTLRLTLSGGSLDFSTILPAKVTSIEAIDLSAAGSQSLTLSALDLFDLSDDRSGGFTRLTVHGNSSDSVSTLDSGWSNMGSTGIGGETYTIFQKGQAQLIVDSDIVTGGILV